MSRRNFFFLVLVCYALFAQSEGKDSIAISSYYSTISYSQTDEIVPRKFSENILERYKGDDFQYEQIVKHNSQWQQFKDWLFELLRKFFNIKDQNAASNWFDNLINFISVVLVVAVVYFIAKALLRKQGNWIFSRSEENYSIEHALVEEELSQADFAELIKKARKKNNYRLIIRYYYLWLLQKMSQKSIIEWDKNKTNSEYQYEIKNKALRNKFSYACYLYDYIWYGEFELDKEKFIYAESNFKNTIENIK